MGTMTMISPGRNLVMLQYIEIDARSLAQTTMVGL